MSNPPPISAARVTEEFVRSKHEFFVDVQLWPRETRLDIDGWLANFTNTEQDHAVHLLNSFLYYSAELTDELFKSAFHGLNLNVVDASRPYVAAESLWRRFRESVLVTHVTGEDPNNSDSGFTFARKARQLLGIDEYNLKAPAEALSLMVSDGPRPVLFVDDFVGSGDQFIRTWGRQYDLNDGSKLSFQRYASVVGTQFFYCPLFCSEIGRIAIQRNCPEVNLAPAHFLTEKYSALVDDSIIWPEHLRATAWSFVHDASERAGIMDYCEIPWQGYHEQGLTIAFEHGIPDATLPIFYFDENGWIPLMSRT